MDKREIHRQIREGERGFTVGKMCKHLTCVGVERVNTNPAVQRLFTSFSEQRAAGIPNTVIAFDAETARQTIEAVVELNCLARVLFILDQSCNTIDTTRVTIPFPTSPTISLWAGSAMGVEEDIAPLVYNSVRIEDIDAARANGRRNAQGLLLSALLKPQVVMDAGLDHRGPTHESLQKVAGVKWSQSIERSKRNFVPVASLDTEIEGIKVVYTFRDMNNPDMSLVVNRI